LRADRARAGPAHFASCPIWASAVAADGSGVSRRWRNDPPRSDLPPQWWEWSAGSGPGGSGVESRRGRGPSAAPANRLSCREWSAGFGPGGSGVESRRGIFPSAAPANRLSRREWSAGFGPGGSGVESRRGRDPSAVPASCLSRREWSPGFGPGGSGESRRGCDLSIISQACNPPPVSLSFSSLLGPVRLLRAFGVRCCVGSVRGGRLRRGSGGPV